MAKICLFSFVLVHLPFSVNAQSTQLNTQSNYHSSDILEAKRDAAHKKRQSLEQLTLTLAKQIKQAESNTQNNKNSTNLTQLNELITTAQSRQKLISELLELSPSAVKHSVLPGKIAKHAPQEIKQYLLHKNEIEGELEVVYQDYQQAEFSRLRYVLKTSTGRVELHFANINANANALSNLEHGTKIKAQGLVLARTDSQYTTAALIDNSADLSLITDPDTRLATANVAPAQLANTLGEQKTLVLLLNFQDNPTEQPWTKADVQQMVFGTVNDFYQEASYGQTWLSGDVQGYLTLPINATCDFGTMDGYAQQAANDSGIDVSSYERLVYLFPKNSACGWRGQGTIGGTLSRSWINGELNLMTIGHELGHNFGLHHAKDLDCGADIIGETCASAAYGDNLDVMGKSTGHFNAFNKEQLGWLTPDLGNLITAQEDGNYLLEPYETASLGGAKGLKVRRGTEASTGKPTWYYIEYRQATGFDSFLQGKTGITDGVVLHLATEADIKSNLLLDMIPNSGLNDLDKAALLTGVSYSDVEAGVTITTEWADNSGVSVSVNYAEQSCVKTTPSLLLSPDESAWVLPGTAVTYRATVTNNNSAECTESNYDITASVPSGWTANSQSLTLTSGQSGTVELEVSSANSTIEGFYDINISAQNSGDTHYQTRKMASYVVQTPVESCVLANPLLNLSVDNSGELIAGTMTTYHGSLTNQDSDSCADADFEVSANVPSGWTSDSSSVNLAPGQSSNISLNVTSATTAIAGTYDFNISAKNELEPTYSNNDVASYIVASPLPSCASADPLIVVSNAQRGDLVAGTQVTYSATITNQDSEECAESSFDVVADVPAKWTASNAQVTLLPGASTVVNINMSSDANAIAGAYNITIYAINTEHSEYQASDIVTYEVIDVAEPSNEAPVAVNDNVILTTKDAITISVLSNDWDPENDGLSIRSVSQGAKGSVTITTNGQILYTPAKSFKNSDSFSYTITDGDKTASATVTLSLTSSGGGNKGKGKR